MEGQGRGWRENERVTQGLLSELFPCSAAEAKGKTPGLCCECNIVITQEIENLEKNQRVKWMERAQANSFCRNFLPVILEDILVFGVR